LLVDFGLWIETMLKPLGINQEELQRAIDIISYLKDHPEENQNTGLVKKLKFVIRQWLDVEYALDPS
jgi:hypothetical protein